MRTIVFGQNEMEFNLLISIASGSLYIHECHWITLWDVCIIGVVWKMQTNRLFE